MGGTSMNGHWQLVTVGIGTRIMQFRRGSRNFSLEWTLFTDRLSEYRVVFVYKTTVCFIVKSTESPCFSSKIAYNSYLHFAFNIEPVVV